MNKSEANTKPCGTPDDKKRDSNIRLFTITH